MSGHGDGHDDGHGHGHSPEHWVHVEMNLYILAPRMPEKPYPGYKPPPPPEEDWTRPNTLYGKPFVRVRWWHDWGIWAWALFFVGILLWIVLWPYSFGYSLGWGGMMHWILPGV